MKRPENAVDGDRSFPFSQSEYDLIKRGMTDTKYFSNDTLHGRAKKVYDDLKAILKQQREEQIQEKKKKDKEKAAAEAGKSKGKKSTASTAASTSTVASAVTDVSDGSTLSAIAANRMPNERQFYRVQHDAPTSSDDNPFADITESEFSIAPSNDGDGQCG